MRSSGDGSCHPFDFPRYALQESHARPDLGAGASTATDLRTGSETVHERFRWLAIEQARKNPKWPFGALIINTRTGDAQGS